MILLQTLPSETSRDSAQVSLQPPATHTPPSQPCPRPLLVVSAAPLLGTRFHASPRVSVSFLGLHVSDRQVPLAKSILQACSIWAHDVAGLEPFDDAGKLASDLVVFLCGVRRLEPSDSCSL